MTTTATIPTILCDRCELPVRGSSPTCQTCDGHGTETEWVSEREFLTREVPCPECDGTGVEELCSCPEDSGRVMSQGTTKTRPMDFGVVRGWRYFLDRDRQGWYRGWMQKGDAAPHPVVGDVLQVNALHYDDAATAMRAVVADAQEGARLLELDKVEDDSVSARSEWYRGESS